MTVTIRRLVDSHRLRGQRSPSTESARPGCLLEDDRYGHVIPIELFYDNVREKWPDGNKQRLAALKRNARVRKLLAEGAAPPPLSENEDSEEEAESEDMCLPCA